MSWLYELGQRHVCRPFCSCQYIPSDHDMTETNKIEGTAENWESRLLGADENYVRRVDNGLRDKINTAIGVRPTSAQQTGHLAE